MTRVMGRIVVGVAPGRLFGRFGGPAQPDGGCKVPFKTGVSSLVRHCIAIHIDGRWAAMISAAQARIRYNFGIFEVAHRNLHGDHAQPSEATEVPEGKSVESQDVLIYYCSRRRQNRHTNY